MAQQPSPFPDHPWGRRQQQQQTLRQKLASVGLTADVPLTAALDPELQSAWGADSAAGGTSSGGGGGGGSGGIATVVARAGAAASASILQPAAAAAVQQDLRSVPHVQLQRPNSVEQRVGVGTGLMPPPQQLAHIKLDAMQTKGGARGLQAPHQGFL